MYILSRATALCLLLAWAMIPAINFAAEGEKVDINTAPLENLIKIVHLGETRAIELISLRPFASLNELSRINGISELRVKDIKNQGIAFVGTECQEKLPIKEIPQEYPKNIIFNELLPSPEGPDAENEWIEIFNKNDFEVNLSGWQITDTEGTTKIFTFPEEKTINTKEYLVLYRTNTKITLNNSGDGLHLLNPLKEIVDSVNYKNAENKNSLSFIKNSWIWNTELTPGEKNVYNEEIEEIQIEKGKEIKLTTIEAKDHYNYIFVATLISLISATLILLIKKNVKIK